MLGHFFPLHKAARIGRAQLTVGLAAVALCGGLLTQGAVAASAPAPGAPAAAGAAPNPPAGSTTWGGLGWGIGIAADFDIGGTRVASASLVNNIVRVTDTSSNVDVSFVLESHYFFALPTVNPTNSVFGTFAPPGGCHPVTQTGTMVTPGLVAGTTETTTKTVTKNNPTNDNSGTNYNCTEWAHGPFVAIEVGGGTSATPSASSPITGYAMGWMIGFRHPNAATSSSTSSWNFGIGLRVDPKAQVLGDGIGANQPLPVGETAIRYKTEPRPGVMLLSSFSF
jgi:hypothetical protein